MDIESQAQVSPSRLERHWIAPVVGWTISIVLCIVAVIRKAAGMLSASLSFCTGRVRSITPHSEFKFTTVDATVLGLTLVIVGAIAGAYFQNGRFYAAGGVGGGSKGPDLAVSHLLLILTSVSFHCTITGAFLRRKTVIATFLTMIGLLSFIVEITVIIWILLPQNLILVPLICGVTSLVALVASSIIYRPPPMNSSIELVITNP